MIFNRIVSIIFVAFILSSCSNNMPSLTKDLSKIKKQDIHIKRYGKVLFAMNKDSFINEVPKLKTEFPLFLSQNTDDTLALLNLESFFSDPYMNELNNMVQKKYPDLNDLELKLSNAFQYYHYYYTLPKVFVCYTYVSGLDINNPIKVIDSNIVIGMDLYLGAKSKVYSMSGFPKYKSKWFIKEEIVPDIMKELASGIMPEKDKSTQLINQMVYEGKKLFFLQAMMPELADTLLLKYTKSQMDWCYKNEAKLWALMVENQFIFSTDISFQKKFMNDAPFTSILSTEAPARLGQFLGWRIVSRYMAKENVALSDLMLEANSQLILKKSKYKPQR